MKLPGKSFLRTWVTVFLVMVAFPFFAAICGVIYFLIAFFLNVLTGLALALWFISKAFEEN